MALNNEKYIFILQVVFIWNYRLMLFSINNVFDRRNFFSFIIHICDCIFYYDSENFKFQFFYQKSVPVLLWDKKLFLSLSVCLPF